MQNTGVNKKLFEKHVDFQTMDKFNISPLTSARMVFEYQTLLKNTESIMKASANCEQTESIWDVETNSVLHVGKPKPVEASDFVDINALIPFCY